MLTRHELVRQKAERAKEQLRELDARLKSFLESGAYVVAADHDSKPGQILYRLACINPVPVLIAHLAGEVIHTLRSTLDHLAYQLLLKATPNASEKERKGMDFPFYDPAKQTESEAFRKIQPLGIDVVEAIRSVKPYKGGNQLLWALNVLDNINKHRTLLTVSTVYAGVDFTEPFHALLEEVLGSKRPFLFAEKRLIAQTALSGYPADVGDILFVGFPIDAERNKYLKFPCTVTLSESEIHAGEPVLEALQSMSDLVDNLVSDFAPLLL